MSFFMTFLRQSVRTHLQNKLWSFASARSYKTFKEKEKKTNQKRASFLDRFPISVPLEAVFIMLMSKIWPERKRIKINWSLTMNFARYQILWMNFYKNQIYNRWLSEVIVTSTRIGWGEPHISFLRCYPRKY